MSSKRPIDNPKVSYVYWRRYVQVVVQMVSISKRIFHGTIAVASLGVAIAAILFPATIVTELLSPFSLTLMLLVPGVLAYLSLTKSALVDLRAYLYGAGLSATLLMTLGFVINLGYRILSVNPLRSVPVWVGFSLLLLFLGYSTDRFVPGDQIKIALPTSVTSYLFASIPIAIGVGALRVEGDGTNVVILLALGVILLLYIVGSFDPSQKAILVYCIALGLLIHNTLISEFLLWGDQAKEANLVYHVLQVGHWDPSELSFVNKEVMLRIVILHPVHKLLSGLEVRQVFKIAHPILFATAPVALYRTFADQGRAQAGYLGAGTLMFFFSFFTVLARNTRTAIAILFIILFVKVLLDTEISRRVRRILLVVFGSSVFVSHYGAGYMFFAILGGGIAVSLAGRKLSDTQWRRMREQLPFIPVLLIGLVSFGWYTYIPPQSVPLGTVVSFIYEFTTRLQEGFFQPSNSATAHYTVASYSSVSLTGIKILTVVLFGIIGFGWLLAAVRSLRGEDGIETNVSYLGMSMVAGALAAVTVGPVERFNTARTIATVLAVVAPLFAIGIEGIVEGVSRKVSVSSWAVPVACLLILVPFFLFSTGLFAATVSHEYSPNVLIYQDEIIEDGSPAAKSYLYKQQLEDTGVQAGRWLNEHGTGAIYGSVWPGNPSTGTIGGDPPGYDYYGNVSAATPSDCIYLDPLSVDAGVIRVPGGHFNSDFLLRSNFDTTNRSLVYANGGAKLYC